MSIVVALSFTPEMLVTLDDVKFVKSNSYNKITKIKAKVKKERGGGGEEKRKLPLPPLSFFALALIFARPKHRNLRGNPTETLATQAMLDKTSSKETTSHAARTNKFIVTLGTI